MDPIRKIPKKFTKKSGNKVINRQYFRRKTGLKSFTFQKMISLLNVLSFFQQTAHGDNGAIGLLATNVKNRGQGLLKKKKSLEDINVVEKLKRKRIAIAKVCTA